LPSSDSNLLLKVYAVVAVSFAARNCEAAELNFEDFERTVTDETLSQGNANHARYVIHHKRAKQTGQATTDGNVSFVTGALEVSIIDEYAPTVPGTSHDILDIRDALARGPQLRPGSAWLPRDIFCET
jgi:hypothetical protein